MSDKKTIEIKKDNLWKYATFILLAIVIILLISGLSGLSLTGKTVSESKAKEKLLEFLNGQTGGGVTFVSAKNNGMLYEMIVLYENQQIPVYVTKDAKYFVYGVESLEPIAQTDIPTNTQTQTSYSEEDLIKLREFSECLSTKGVKIYGANWCGYTKQWVEKLGGYDSITPIYIECTEQDDICNAEGIQGYPTTKINGQTYSGARTIEAIATETGCAVPVLEGTVSGTTATASC